MTSHIPKRFVILPTDWKEREALREKGQFWTPEWVADAMVSYVISSKTATIFDPAVGGGAFLLAAKRVAAQRKQKFILRGTELFPEVLSFARANGLGDTDLARVEITDFVLDPPPEKFDAIVANPPYIRHHRIPAKTKEKLREFCAELIGEPLDLRAGYHIYFLLRALQLLNDGGALAFIVPADTVEGVFARQLWAWISKYFRIEAVVTFAPDATPFPRVDTNPIILMIRREKPRDSFYWIRVVKPATPALCEWVQEAFGDNTGRAGKANLVTDALQVMRRELQEGLAEGLSRPPAEKGVKWLHLIDFARVMRGIATGDNDYFLLTKDQAEALRLPPELLLRAVARTRDVADGNEITQRTLEQLEKEGRPTFLFSPDGRPIDEFPLSVRTYLRVGEEKQLPTRALIQQRKPWYKMERRTPPPFLFAYLGRRSARFIRNRAAVVPLTGFLCVYPHSNTPKFLNALWALLQQPQVIENLARVGKSYGSGAIKVEPRPLEQLPIPLSLVEEVGLSSFLGARERQSHVPKQVELDLATQGSNL